MEYNIIVAFSKNKGIGLKNRLPWNIPSDLKKFKTLTTGNGNNAVIMGKNTWESLPIKYLTYRDNLILSSNLKIDTTYDNNIVKSFCDVNTLQEHCEFKKYDNVWIIGGEQVYKEFLNNKKLLVKKIYVTYIDKYFECDTFFPDISFDKYPSVLEKEHIIKKMITTNNDNSNDNSNDFKIYDRIYYLS